MSQIGALMLKNIIKGSLSFILFNIVVSIIGLSSCGGSAPSGGGSGGGNGGGGSGSGGGGGEGTLFITLDKQQTFVPGKPVTLTAKISGTAAASAHVAWAQSGTLTLIPSLSDDNLSITFTPTAPDPCYRKDTIIVTATAVSGQLTDQAQEILNIIPEWCTISTDNTPDLGSDDIKKVAVASSGINRVYVATADGISTLDNNQTWTAYSPSNASNLISPPITILALAPGGDVWLANGQSHGLQTVIGGDFANAAAYQSVTAVSDIVNALALHPAGHSYTAYIGTNDGAVILAPGKDPATILSGQTVWSVNAKFGETQQIYGVDASGITSKGQAFIFRIGGGIIPHTATWPGGYNTFGRSNAWLRSILVSDNENIWLGLGTLTAYAGHSGGIVSAGVNGTQQVLYQNPDSSWSSDQDDIRAIAQDSDGNIWFATAGGLLKLDAAHNPPPSPLVYPFTLLVQGPDSGLPCNDIRDVFYESANNMLWIATSCGLVRHWLGERSGDGTLSISLSPVPEKVRAGEPLTLTATVSGTLADSAQVVWSHNLSQAPTLSADNNTLVFTPAEQIPCYKKQMITFAATATSGTIASEPATALVEVVSKVCTINTDTSPGLESNDVKKVAMSSSGISRLYAATAAGVSTFDNNLTWTGYTSSNGLPSGPITSLAVAPNGDVWLANAQLNGLQQVLGGEFADSNSYQSIDVANAVNTIAFSDGQNGKFVGYVGTTDGAIIDPTGASTAILAGQNLPVYSIFNGQTAQFYGTDVSALAYYLANTVYAFDGPNEKKAINAGIWGGTGYIYENNAFAQALFQDAGGGIWIGLKKLDYGTTFGYGPGGIVYLSNIDVENAPLYTVNPFKETPVLNDIRAITQDQTGNMWFATAAGLLMLPAAQNPPPSGYPFAFIPGLPCDDIRDLFYEAANNMLWMATSCGVTRYWLD